MRNAGLEEAQAGIKIARRNINNLRYVDDNKLQRILREMEIPEHLICLLRNLYAGQEAIVRTRYGVTDWFQIGKAVRQGCIL